MSMSDSSSLSSAPSSDDEMPDFPPNLDGTSTPRPASSPATKVQSSPLKKRAASPPHEEVFADDPDIAVLVMFRSRFSEAFPPKLSHFGPQDIERGLEENPPSSQMESFLCALLGLVLNRKKPVERGHYGRALEDAVLSHRSQWPRAWNKTNPLSGGQSFNTMGAKERLTLLKSLLLWSLHESDAISGIIKDSYKQNRHEDDLNQPLSVQAWGRDNDKRQFWLVEGQDDTSFRLYREGNRALKNIPWRSVAGSIEELREYGLNLSSESGQAPRRLGERILAAIPRFEATEEKRKRREYRLNRKAQFSRPDLGFSLYEGRTRGKRMRYTFSDEEDDGGYSDDSARPSKRTSDRATPADPSKPTVTASGRQVRSRMGGTYGESLLSGQAAGGESGMTSGYDERSNASREPSTADGRATRSGAAQPDANGLPKVKKHIEGYNSVDELDDEDEASSSGGEWDRDEDDIDDKMDDAEDEDDEPSEEDEDEEDGPKRSLVVTLKTKSDGSGKDIPSLDGTSDRKSSPAEQLSVSARPVNEQTPTMPSPTPNRLAIKLGSPIADSPSRVANGQPTPPVSQASSVITADQVKPPQMDEGVDTTAGFHQVHKQTPPNPLFAQMSST
ncbi:hypothetical protein K402DRAFT_356303 [Aulographum hederae CBS 113979]|uniref:WHIM1 domain-containing protein n=1 Tax=Aulographum hederae CBS 113979 TaxID=1176131 RepID=A0A6G1GYL9_9PEZI|nr:hypothetical protein K402DRAFT_356303 [Aulographum hederae CBS 113979]